MSIHIIQETGRFSSHDFCVKVKWELNKAKKCQLTRMMHKIAEKGTEEPYYCAC